MEHFKSFLILILLLVSSQLVQAQILSVDKPIAKRGDTVNCALYYRFANDSVKCKTEARYFEFGPKNGVPSQINLPDINYINDTVTNFNLVVPKEYVDGTQLNLTLKYVLSSFEPKSQTQLGCDSFFIPEFIVVQGGDYNPTITQVSPNSFEKLDTVTLTVSFKEVFLYDSMFDKIQFVNPFNNWLIYNTPILSSTVQNDSTASLRFIVPFDIPNGQYVFNLYSENYEPYWLECKSQWVDIIGNDSIPSVKEVNPKQISRGLKTNVQIRFESLKLSQLRSIPFVSADLANISDIKVENDSILSCTILANTVGQRNSLVLKIKLYEGQDLLYYVIPFSTNKPLGYVKLDKNYILSLGQTDTLILKGENTHFKNGKVVLQFEDTLAGSVINLDVIDTVTIKAVVRVRESFKIIQSSPQYLLFSDDESPIETRVGWPIILVSESPQNKWWRMEPPRFYKNSISTYYFYLLNDSIRLRSAADRWSLDFNGAYFSVKPEMSYCERVNDSTIACQIRFQEAFNDRFCTVDFRYISPRVGLNIRSTDAFQMVSTGILDEPTPKHSLFVYPNPSSGIFTINLNGRAFKPLSIIVFDITGKQIIKEKLGTETILNLNYELDVQNGFYFIELETTEGIYLSKISILK